MAYVLTALWRANEGEEKAIADVLAKMAPPSRQEPGCLMYQPHRSTDDARLFFIYEQYVDAAAYEAHMATPHFERYARGEAFPKLESRERAFYQTMDI
jgi:quinol monooxygenase YgiN